MGKGGEDHRSSISEPEKWLDPNIPPSVICARISSSFIRIRETERKAKGTKKGTRKKRKWKGENASWSSSLKVSFFSCSGKKRDLVTKKRRERYWEQQVSFTFLFSFAEMCFSRETWTLKNFVFRLSILEERGEETSINQFHDEEERKRRRRRKKKGIHWKIRRSKQHSLSPTKTHRASNSS